MSFRLMVLNSWDKLSDEQRKSTLALAMFNYSIINQK